MINNNTAKKLKKDFPIFKYNKNLVYLDNAATSQKPKQVINSLTRFYSKDYANIHRGVYKLSEKATELYLKSKKIISEFINADSEKEIIFTKNTTESLNLLSYVLPSILKKSRTKKEIVLTEMEHHSNLIPWQKLAKRNNMKLKFIKMNNNFSLDLKDAKKKITKKTDILAITHISNSLGVINPVKEIIKIAKKKNKNILTIVDAAQSVPHIKVDVRDLGCDFLAFSGHKILGPTGIGVLYGKKDLLEKLSPFLFGGEMIKKVTYKNAEWAEIPKKFEAGTPNIAGAISLGTAIKYIENIGIENIEIWERKLIAYAIKKLNKMPEVKVYNSSKNSLGILSFNIQGVHPHDVASLLDKKGITIRAGHHCNMPLMKKLKISGTCRISFYFYNTFEDIDKFVNELKKVIKKFK